MGGWGSGGGLAAVLDEDAAVHDDADVVGFGEGGGFEVADALLDPEVGELEGDHFFDDGGDVLGKAEDVDNVGFGGESGERGIDGFAEDGGRAVGEEGGIDGQDAVAVGLHVGGNGVAGLGGIV